jgi:hypothetical protein
MTNSFLSSRVPAAAQQVPNPISKAGLNPAAQQSAAAAVAYPSISIVLSAALLTVRDQQPWVQLIEPSAAGSPMLPVGALLPGEHRNLEAGIRALVAAQAGIELGYTEQLYTFSGQGRVTGSAAVTAGAPDDDTQRHLVSIGYLGLLAATHVASARTGNGARPQASRWAKCYDILPWEDWRDGRPAILDETIAPRLTEWADRPVHLFSGEPEGVQHNLTQSRQDRIDLAFGSNGAKWNDELTLERHELLYEAGLLCEARRDRGISVPYAPLGAARRLGVPLACDHRRMLAMALGRLRAKIKCQPVVFELMADTFTLYELQCTVQAVLGTPLHKQNFRRLVATTGLVADVGEIRAKTGGRPAKLYRFRSHVVMERAAPGVRIKGLRN